MFKEKVFWKMIAVLTISLIMSIISTSSPSFAQTEPTITALTVRDTLNFNNFPVGNVVIFEVYESQAGYDIGDDPIFGPETKEIFDVLDGYRFVELQPGNLVIAEDPATAVVAQLIIQPLEITSIIKAESKVTGTAEDSAEVEVQIKNLGGEPVTKTVTAVDGTWTADFTGTGITISDETAIYAHIYDDQGDATEDSWDYPRIVVHKNSSFIAAEGIVPEEPFTLRVYQDDSKRDLLYEYTDIAENIGYFPFPNAVHHIKLDWGMYFELENPIRDAFKTMVLPIVATSYADYDNHFISGYGEYDKVYTLDVETTQGFKQFEINPNYDDTWSLDLASMGYELVYGTYPVLRTIDEDGDVAENSIEPTFGVRTVRDTLYFHNFTVGNVVIFEVFENQDAYDNNEAPIFGPETFSITDFWENTYRFVELQVGNLVRVEDFASGKVKELVIQPIEITGFNKATKTVTGTAPDDALVEVQVQNAFNPETQWVTPVNGTWTADFSEFEIPISDETAIRAYIYDEDGDATEDGWEGSLLGADTGMFFIGFGGVPEEPFTFRICQDNTKSDLLYEFNGIADNNGGYELFLEDHRIFLKPGMYLELEVPIRDLLKNLELVPIYVDSVNYTEHKVYGRAPFGGVYKVELETTEQFMQFEVTPTEDNTWVLDVAAEGYQILEGYTPTIFYHEGDRDHTMFTMQAVPYCAPGTSISGMIYEADGITPLNEAGINIYDPDTYEVLYRTFTWPDGSYGCDLPDGEYLVSAWHRIGNIRYSREFYNDQYIIEDSNVISVAGGVGSTDIDFVFNLPRTSFEQFTFNHSDPIIGELAVRQAIAYGTNRQQFVDLFYQYDSYVMDSYELRGFWAYADTGLPQYNFDRPMAETLLTNAGWVDTDSDEIRDKDGIPLHIDYYYPEHSAWPEDRALQADLFKADMAAIGIDVSIHTYGNAIPLREVVESKDFGILAFTWVSMYTGMGLGDLYYTSDPFDFYSGNWGYYSNPVADQYWDEALAATTMNDKLPWLHAHQIEILSDLAMLPLYQRCEFGDSDCDMVVDLIDVCPHDSTDTCNQDNSTAELINEDGGTVTTQQGSVEVSIPSGALDNTTPISVTDIGHGFVLETDIGESFVVMGVELGPEGQIFNAPVEVILSWEDTEVPGIVDGTSINEGDLFISKDGEAITGLCSEELSRCDQLANTFTVEVMGFSQFVLVALPDVELGEISGPSEPVPVGELVDVSVPLFSNLPSDLFTATWKWGDSTSIAGTIGDGLVTGSHAFAEAGVYTVTLTLAYGTNTDTATFEYIVVFDPDGGFVTGGGWIDSPTGAYVAEPALTGKATFGFVSKYKKGAKAPTGNTEFQFKVADLNFHSSSYDWLVVTGSDNARFKGTGTINGMGKYKFMIWAGDGETDTFRIKIWEEDEFGVETVIYDNSFDQAITGGNIVVHNK